MRRVIIIIFFSKQAVWGVWGCCQTFFFSLFSRPRAELATVLSNGLANNTPNVINNNKTATAVKSRPTSSEDDASGGEGSSGGDSIDGVGVGDGLDDLDGTPYEAEEHRQWYQAQLCTFNAKRANRQGCVVDTASGGVSDAPSGDGEGDSSLRSSNGAAAAAVIQGITPWETVTSSHHRHRLRKTAERVPAAVGKASKRFRPPRYLSLHPRQRAERELSSRYFPGGTGAT